MENNELELEKFKWQKMKFMVVTFILTMGLAMFTMLFYYQNQTKDFGRESNYYIQNLKENLYESEAKQAKLYEEIRQLELRYRNLDDFTKSLKENAIENQELLLTLRKEIEKIKEASNERVVE